MTTLGKYELHEEIGRGGFGTVYRATDTTLQREVALKVLHPQLTTDPDFLDKFRKEAQIVAGLESRDIVTIFEMDEVDGRVFIAMQYMAGGSLKEKLAKEGALSFEETLTIMRQVCAGLEVAHEQGLVHRDIKPANILFDAKGNAVISDFGLAKAIHNSSITAATSMGGVGTPAYRAPELWEGNTAPSPATDIYSLACVLSEMLSGEVLFDGDTTSKILTKHLVKIPEIPEDIPDRIRQVLEKALEKSPTNRYLSVNEMLQEIKDPDTSKQKDKIFSEKISEPSISNNLNEIAKKEVDQNTNKTRAGCILFGIVGVISLVAILLWGINVLFSNFNRRSETTNGVDLNLTEDSLDNDNSNGEEGESNINDPLVNQNKKLPTNKEQLKEFIIGTWSCSNQECNYVRFYEDNTVSVVPEENGWLGAYTLGDESIIFDSPDWQFYNYQDCQDYSQMPFYESYGIIELSENRMILTRYDGLLAFCNSPNVFDLNANDGLVELIRKQNK